MRQSDYRRKIIEYFKKNLKKGYTPESLKWALVNQGYLRVSVEEGLKEAQKEMAAKAPLLKEKPVIKYEVFDEQDKPIEIKKPWWKKLLGI